MSLHDFEIKNDVLSLLSSEKIKNLRVDVFNGFVILSGIASSNKSRNEISLKVMEIEGVVSVRNKIKSLPGKKFKYRHEKFFFNPQF